MRTTLLCAATTAAWLAFAPAATAQAPAAPPRLITPTVDLSVMAAGEDNAWFGASKAILGEPVGGWNEGMLEGGVNLFKEWDGRGTLVGRLSAQLSWTRGGLDAAGTNVDDRSPEMLLVDDAWIGWKSGSGPTRFEASLGRLVYQVGTGFLFWDGGYEGRDRGASWVNGHDVFKFGVLASVGRGAFTLRGAYLEPDDRSTTRILGADAEFSLGEAGVVAGTYHHLLESDAAETIGITGRDGLYVVGLRAALTPFAAARGLNLAGELAFQNNGDARDGMAGYGEVAYQADAVSWTPRLSYRYSSFSGDDPKTPVDEAWDPIFFGFSDWGTWYLGEILGEYAATNTNLGTHQIGLELTPANPVRTILSYYHFQFNQRPAVIVSPRVVRPTNVRSRDIGDEVNLVVEWTITDYLEIGAVGGVLFPGGALKQFSRAGQEWLHGLVNVKIGF
jgi:hypothetical protein